MRWIAAATVATFLWLGCGEAVGAESESTDPRLDSLQRELLRLRQEKTVAEVESARLRQIIARLEAELAAARVELTARDYRAETDAGAPVTETSDVPGSEPVQGIPVAERSSIEEEDLTDEELGEPAPPVLPTETSVLPTETSVSPSGDIDPVAQALYDQSYTQFHEHRYREAEDGFQRFLDNYPETELTDNAQYWVGECRFAQQRFEEALEAFLATVERYPDGNKVPDAFYKAGRCLELQGARDRAVETYEQTLSRFPSSAAAISARERLAALR